VVFVGKVCAFSFSLPNPGGSSHADKRPASNRLDAVAFDEIRRNSAAPAAWEEQAKKFCRVIRITPTKLMAWITKPERRTLDFQVT
jgi:hypothetical protein